MKLESISYAAIQKATKDVLQENEWPVCKDHDDAGLSERHYVKFVGQVLTKLRHTYEGR